jgi:methyl-accepting chemotaxis protein
MIGMIDAMRGDAAALASSANIDADRLRRTEERLVTVGVQARSDVVRGSVLAERAVESESMLTAGSLAMQASLDGVGGVLRSADAVQDLARKAGLLAVRAAVSPSGTGDDAAVLHAAEARALATDAAAAGSTITRIMIGGTECAYEAGVAFDRVALAVKDCTSLVREIGATSLRQASELQEIDAVVSQVTRTTSNSAETARQLVHRLDALAAHARRLEATVRRASHARGASIITVSQAVAAPLRTAPPVVAHA